MLIRIRRDGFDEPSGSDITPRAAYLQRRAWLKALAGGAAGTALAGWAARDALAQSRPGKLAPLAAGKSTVAGAMTMEKTTDYADVTSYNNFYEFGTGKGDPARRAHAMKTQPWSVDVEGLVHKPGRIGLDDLLKLGAMEERIYRLRCVEGWSMVIPWIGYSLSALIQRVQPQGNARYVEFVTRMDEQAMPGLRTPGFDWPYTEALRLDEAMHPLTLLAFGMYGEVLPHQNGAPLRLVVPWKYGFKSIKSVVKLRFVEQQPRTLWQKIGADEYGFYSNVNPDVDHPRWSQATERRIGEDGLFSRKRKTLMFNGYEAQVGQLYAGMDLRKHF
ncbi:protein-methionine-sulfoxide reductase catalytic subunit MsrP [Ottowia sp. SB7-C50]|uniref:protein-methionine-sulfoxide reductase catalytic subunit MsrP n=1 Tax=Ottowia sp. SB7-C50 TaxID=3081231 RepID=UPI00295548E0|nr:protein-methionine-sulfoxide reductase catalytic subunit MsrP [Ottowia sp. SB7-C50]WOP14968.1 protein-methionine-sulfoxide reductase catalytic subunit MsrP [Ottowia sp. SB7-C50]